MQRFELPVSSDLSPSSLLWAKSLLEEAPRVLCVAPFREDVAYATEVTGARFADIRVEMREGFEPNEWMLVGDTREIHSEGA